MQTKFSQEDKDACLPIIDMILECADVARMKGILELEKHVATYKNVFFKFGMALVVDGTDPALVKEMLHTLITFGNHKDHALLERLIIADGILAIQEGQNPRIIKAKLQCYLGEVPKLNDGKDLSPETQEAVAASQRYLNDYMTDLQSFNNLINSLTNHDIRKLLVHLTLEEIAVAVHVCNKDSVIRILANLPKPLTLEESHEIHISGTYNSDDFRKILSKIRDTIYTQGIIRSAHISYA